MGAMAANASAMSSNWFFATAFSVPKDAAALEAGRLEMGTADILVRAKTAAEVWNSSGKSGGRRRNR